MNVHIYILIYIILKKIKIWHLLHKYDLIEMPAKQRKIFSILSSNKSNK